MNSLTTLEAMRMAEQSISLFDALTQWHRTGRLGSELRSVGIQRILRNAAEELRLTPDDSQLQIAADEFRRKNGILKLAETMAWLKDRQLSTSDFEAIVEQNEIQRVVFDAVTAEAEIIFRREPESWDMLDFKIVDVPSENLAAEIRSQVEEDGTSLSKAVELCKSQVSSLNRLTLFRRQVGQVLSEQVKNARIGELLGPNRTKQGWRLLQLDSVRSAEFNLETELDIRNRLYSDWLKKKIAASSVSYPLLDLLSCQNDS